MRRQEQKSIQSPCGRGPWRLEPKQGVIEHGQDLHTHGVALHGVYDRDESEDRGAGMVEYALLVALIGVTFYRHAHRARGRNQGCARRRYS